MLFEKEFRVDVTSPCKREREIGSRVSPREEREKEEEGRRREGERRKISAGPARRRFPRRCRPSPSFLPLRRRACRRRVPFSDRHHFPPFSLLSRPFRRLFVLAVALGRRHCSGRTCPRRQIAPPPPRNVGTPERRRRNPSREEEDETDSRSESTQRESVTRILS